MTSIEENALRERINDLFYYSPDTGLFTRKAWRGGTAVAGSVGGAQNGNGYLRMHIDGVLFYCHRLAFLFVHGYMPKHVDHINGVRDDNRIENLRCATNQENMRNRGKTKNNKSGYKGVSWDEWSGKWVAKIKVDGKAVNLGRYILAEDASLAYETAAARNFGAFNPVISSSAGVK